VSGALFGAGASNSPPDPLLDRDGYFERCWPAAGSNQSFEYKRLIAAGDEVIVTYARVLTAAAGATRRS
jgi:hypothetical protein